MYRSALIAWASLIGTEKKRPSQFVPSLPFLWLRCSEYARWVREKHEDSPRIVEGIAITWMWFDIRQKPAICVAVTLLNR